MFAGHIGVAMAVGRVERRVNLGVFVTCALLLDILLWLFILLGWESVGIPPDFAATHQPYFEFPYSHGLLAAVAWAALAGALAVPMYSRLGKAKWRAAVLIVVAVLSHWLLDALVHRPELPLVGGDSVDVGLALWNHMPVALALEAAIVALGMYVYITGSGLSRGKCIALILLGTFIVAFTVIGMTVAPPPPSAMAMAGSSLITLIVVCVLFAWLGRLPP
jgi:hypothetical protein